MIRRRSFGGILFGWVAAAAVAQKPTVMEKGKAVACENDATECPNGHKTCTTINAPIVVGNDSYQNPDVGQLRDFHVMRCDICHVLFTRE